MQTVELLSGGWSWEAGEPTLAEHLGRECARLRDTTGLLDGVELSDGVVEVELAAGPERGFHGVVWRARDFESLESFYVRPHQVGNPDAVQYTPFFNGVGGFQLYHGPGFWAPAAFPIGEWFTIRVVFAGARAEVYVGDTDEPALAVAELKHPPAPGRVGVMTGVGAVHVARFSFDDKPVAFRTEPPAPPPRPDGVIEEWSVSDPFPEARLDGDAFAGRTWADVRSEPGGLVDLARLAGIRDAANTVLARTTIRSAEARTAELTFGFSDRVAVYLNGRLLYRGADEYRSRDYRFLGSIGWFDRLTLPLAEGDNDLVLAVTEDFGGWGLQARLTG